MALVEASLGQLNERYRTALVLKDLQGLEPAEIAEVMEVSRPNADVLVHRARASFKAAFAKLAGDVPAPAALGAVLLPLSLPAALQAMPSFAHPAAPPAHAPAPAPHAPVGHGVHLPGLSHAGPAGAGGLLGKIGAALTTKIGITAAAATLVIGGTVAVKEVQHAHAHPWTGTPGHAWQAPASQVEQALGPLEPLRALDEARLADGLELRALVLERPHGRLVLDHGQRLHVVERRHDVRQLELGRRQLDDVDQPHRQLGLVLGQRLERLRLVEEVRLRRQLVGQRLEEQRRLLGQRLRRQLGQRLERRRQLGQRLVGRLRHGRRLVGGAHCKNGAGRVS